MSLRFPWCLLRGSPVASHAGFLQGWKGLHTEGGVWSLLFGLLMWDALFDGSVPGAFVHAFHTAPLDLGSDSFWGARRDTIEVIRTPPS